jgi:hypothetical protein
MAVATALFAVATLAVLWRARRSLATRRGLAVGLGFALVAGVVGAPKESFWNGAIVLVAVGLLLAVDVPDLRFDRFGRLDRWLLAGWFASSVAWAAVWAVEPPASGSTSAVVTFAWSLSLYGLIGMWWLFARLLLRPIQAAGASTIS